MAGAGELIAAPGSCPQMWGWCLCSGWGVGRLPPWTRTHIRPASRRGLRRWWPSSRSWPPRTLEGLTDGARAERVRGAAGAGGPPRRPVAGRAGRGGRPGGGWGRGGDPGWLDGRVAAGPAADGGGGGRHGGADRPGPVRWPLDRDRPGPDRRGASPWPMPRCWPTAPRSSPTTWPPRPSRCWWRRRGGWTRRGCGGSWAISWLAADPEGAEGQAERQPPAPGPVGLAHPGGHGRGGRAAGGRGRPDRAGRPGAAGPPRQRRTTPARGGQRRADALTELARRNLESRPAPPDRVGSGPSCW